LEPFGFDFRRNSGAAYCMNLAPLEQSNAFLDQRTPAIDGSPGNAIFLLGSLPVRLCKVDSRIVNRCGADEQRR
jgi:hypothetical protein